MRTKQLRFAHWVCGLTRLYAVWGTEEWRPLGLAAVSLATWSYTGAARLDCLSDVERPFLQRQCPSCLTWCEAAQEAGVCSSSSIVLCRNWSPDGISKSKKPQVTTLSTRHAEYLKSKVFWKGHACSCCMLLRWAPKTPPEEGARGPHQRQEITGSDLQFPQCCVSSLSPKNCCLHFRAVTYIRPRLKSGIKAKKYVSSKPSIKPMTCAIHAKL